MLERETFEKIDPIEKYGVLYEALPGHLQKIGITVEQDGCNVAVWSGMADFVDVCLFEKENINRPTERWRLHKDAKFTDFSCGFIPDLKPGDIYGIRAEGEWDPANQIVYSYDNLLLDPRAKAITSGENPKCVVVDERYDWENDQKPNIPRSETIIYEGHVKDATKLLEKIPENIRGTYAGVASDEFISHIKKIGITALELMPIQQFLPEPYLKEKGLTNHWGYNTIGFFAPHGNYSSSGEYGEQVKEFKDMVKKLHKNGLEVILDVVYNHTAEGSEGGPTISFKGLGAYELYLLSQDKKHCNYTGCGNTFNASSKVGLRFILESLRYWATDMHVDGFRFDLAPSLAREAPNGWVNMDGKFMNAIKNDPILNKLKIIAEPWDCGCYELNSFSEPWMVWNDQFRDGIRDFWRGNGNLGDFAYRLSGSPLGNRSVNYVTSHDGDTVNDLVSYNDKHNYENGEDNRDGTDNNRSCNHGVEGPTDDPNINEIRYRAALNMILSTMIATGTPMMSHGDEVLRTQNGNNNAYCQDNEISWVHYNLSDRQSSFYDCVSKIINLRKNNPVFKRNSEYLGKPSDANSTESDIAWYKNDGYQFEFDDPAWHKKQVLGMFLSGIAIKSAMSQEPVNGHSFLYYANGTYEDQEIYLPRTRPYAGIYEVAFDTAERNSSEGMLIDSDKFVIKALSSIVLKKVASHIRDLS